MQAEINEQMSKTNPWLSFTIRDKETMYVAEKEKGPDSFSKLVKYFETHQKLIRKVQDLRIFHFKHPIDYVLHFTHVQTISFMGRSQLRLPDLHALTSLQTLYVNQQTKPFDLTNIETIQNLSELRIGDFSFGKPVEISSLNALTGCKALRKLILVNVKLPDDQLNILSEMQLDELYVHNKKYRDKIEQLNQDD